MPKNIINNQEDINNLPISDDETDGETGSSSSGGSRSGQIEFKEFVAKTVPLREDLMPPEERKRLLIVHGQINEASVKKQKARREEYKALKEGRMDLHAFRQAGLSGGGVKPHFLADKRQFSGADKQVNPLGTEHVSETNNDKKNELHYRLELQNRPEFVPRSAPKPNPFGKMG